MQMRKVVQIYPLDPIMARDGRPFGDTPGATAHSMSDLSPSVIAGTIRTLLSKEVAQSGSRMPNYEEMRKLKVRGPLVEWQGQVYYPFPADAVISNEDETPRINYLKPTPISGGEGCLGIGHLDRHMETLWPVNIDQFGKKWRNQPSYIRSDWMESWLLGYGDQLGWTEALKQWSEWETLSACIGPAPDQSPFLRPHEREVRVHNAIDPHTLVTEDEKLFSSESLRFYPGVSLLTEVDVPSLELWSEAFSEIHPMGGKRRLSHFRESEHAHQWKCPNTIIKALDGTNYVRMVLVTPTFFAKGWLPGWLNTELETNELFATKFGLSNIRLRLRWACLDRWQPVSGWSYRQRSEKAVRRMVPAGSVYFFEVLEGNPGLIAEKLWLATVSDENRRGEAYDHEDGFGLAVWGSWCPDR